MAYKIVWEDQFDQDGAPNPAHWHLETGGHGFGNNEEQYYTDRLDNAFVKDGILTIVAKQEAYQNRHYTSAKLTTYTKHHMTGGRIEVVAKLPKGIGTWPAIWLLGVNMQSGVLWPLCGEIDIMEHVGHNPGVVHSSLHSQSNYLFLNNQPVEIVKRDGLQDGFHLYAMDWESDVIRFRIDDETHGVFHKPKNATVEQWPFDKPFYLIMNIALGGSWGGPIVDQDLPARFEFKSVKVFEKSDDGE
ncbi:MAG: glycoside hydrolase family 16 protein [Acholeplasmataceae bacterium]|nr:glycoside hydrolase family 16 protein [Acholeplasmataceae bacterium]